MYVPYEQVDVAGDAGLRIRGRNLEELLKNAAKGLFDMITDIDRIEVKENRQLTIEAEGMEDLLIRWLNDLIFTFDAEGFIVREFDININQTTDRGLTLRALLHGENFDPEKHESRLLIKAATYHNLSITKRNDLWEAIVVFDI